MRGEFYRVEKGDTMWRIAHNHGIEVDTIQRANPQLDIHRLSVNERIFLPGISEADPQKPKLNTAQWVPPKKKEGKTTRTSPKLTRPKTFSKKPSFRWPYKGRVISKFGMRNRKMHNGIDIQVPKGQNLRAAANGKVVYVGDQIEGYDRIVILLHDRQIFTIYAFVDQFLVKKGQIVDTGTPIAKAKSISNSFFHFEIRHIKTSLDPLKHLP